MTILNSYLSPNITKDIYIYSNPIILQPFTLNTLNVSCRYPLNPYTDIFIPLHKSLATALCGMIALYTTSLILSAFILNKSFNKNGKHDIEDLSPRISQT